MSEMFKPWLFLEYRKGITWREGFQKNLTRSCQSICSCGQFRGTYNYRIAKEISLTSKFNNEYDNWYIFPAVITHVWHLLIIIIIIESAVSILTQINAEACSNGRIYTEQSWEGCFSTRKGFSQQMQNFPWKWAREQTAWLCLLPKQWKTDHLLERRRIQKQKHHSKPISSPPFTIYPLLKP